MRTTALGNELALMELSRVEAEDSVTFIDSVIEKRCLLRSKLEEKRKNKLHNLQEPLLHILDDPALTENRGKNRGKGRKRRKSSSCSSVREIIPSCLPTCDNDNLRYVKHVVKNNDKLPLTRSKNHFSQASSLSSFGSTNQSRALLERGRAALNRAPTSSTVITWAPSTLEMSAGDSHHEHADSRHYRRKHFAKQKKWRFFRLGICTMPKPKRHRYFSHPWGSID